MSVLLFLKNFEKCCGRCGVMFKMIFPLLHKKCSRTNQIKKSNSQKNKNKKMIEVSFQLSLGRFPMLVNEDESIRDIKKKLRTSFPRELLQVNINAFRFNVNGKYLSDESMKLKDVGVNANDVIHFVKKNACANAQLDTEVPSDE